ncbi:MAG: orotidine-5'-phosphate decarboxylase [Gemmatimonadetes bacterium]|nr:orotidine-5'-phosphate decarboxylase [Gemmatimonadota bacterium]
MSVSPLTPQPIVALDVPTLVDAQQLVARLGDRADYYKVGLQLFTAVGPRVVEWLRSQDKRVFLDLKLHDIPNTVRGAAESAAHSGVSLLTVHAHGGEAMVRAAVEGAGEHTGILAVTVLTSMDAPALGTVLGREVDVAAEVLRYAGVASAAGAHGVVCAGSECAAVRARYADLRPLVPGIRAAGGATHDQARVVTPREASRAGAAYVIFGRAVTASPDPAAAYAALTAELASA